MNAALHVHLLAVESRSMEPERAQAVFATTHWSVVLAAGDASSPARAGALEQLCQNCCYLVYAFLRRLGHNPADAQELTQWQRSAGHSGEPLSGRCARQPH